MHARGELPSDLPVVAITFGTEPDRALTRIIADAGLADSASDAGRKLQQGGVRVDGERTTDVKRRLRRDRLPALLQVGRRAVQLVSGD